MTPKELIKLLRENAEELGKHVRRLKVGEVEVEFVSSVPEVAAVSFDEEHPSNDPLKDPRTFQGGYHPVERS